MYFFKHISSRNCPYVNMSRPYLVPFCVIRNSWYVSWNWTEVSLIIIYNVLQITVLWFVLRVFIYVIYVYTLCLPAIIRDVYSFRTWWVFCGLEPIYLITPLALRQSYISPESSCASLKYRWIHNIHHPKSISVASLIIIVYLGYGYPMV